MKKPLMNYLTLICLFLSYSVLNAQTPTLKHSYTFDDGSAKDHVGNAHGVIKGGKIEDGNYITSEEGEYIELPADQININTYESLTLEAYIVAGEADQKHTMISFFGDTLSNGSADSYIFQAVQNGGKTMSSILCKNTHYNTGRRTAVDCKSLKDGKPHHVVNTYDNKEIKMYVDGLLVDQKTNTSPNNQIKNIGTHKAYLAKSGYGHDETWIGSIDTYNIYEGVLDAGTIDKKAQEYLPEDVLVERRKLAGGGFWVDQSGEFDKPITEKGIVFFEMTATDSDNNNRFKQQVHFNDINKQEGDKYTSGIRMAYYEGYIDVFTSHEFTSTTEVPFAPGQAFQCWVSFDIPSQTYDVYVQNDEMESPVAVLEDAKFRKEVTAIATWEVIHDLHYSDEAMSLKALTMVEKVGELPPGYQQSESMRPFRIAEAEIPEGAKVVNDPIHGYKSGSMHLKKVVMTANNTELYFETRIRPGSWISIPKETFIKLPESEEKLFIQSAEGIPMRTRYYGPNTGHIEYKLVFPAIDPEAEAFDYGEDNGNWFIYTVRLNAPVSKLPESLAGNWFNTETGDWQVSLLNDVAIYQGKVWQYEDKISNPKKGTIKLGSDGASLTLIYKVKNKKLLIGESKKSLAKLDQKANYSNVPNPSNPPAWTAPVLKMDTAVFSGYINGYSPTIGSSTGRVSVNNIITGNQESHLIEIKDDGSYRVKIPILYPQVVFVRADLLKTRLFLEPGKEVFVLTDLSDRMTPIAMGANARLISELMTRDLDQFRMTRFYREKTEKVLGMSADEYKDFCEQAKDEDLNTLEELFRSGKASVRFYQMKKLSIINNYAEEILRYDHTAESAYRKEKGERLPADMKDAYKLPASSNFYDFISIDLLNDPMGFISSDYKGLINAFKYSPAAWSREARVFSPVDLAQMAKKHDAIKPGHEELVEGIIENFTEDFLESQEQFRKHHGKLQGDFIRANMDEYRSIYEESKDAEVHPMVTFFEEISQSDSISDDDRAFCKVVMNHYSHPTYLFETKNRSGFRELFTNYSTFVALAMSEKRNELLASKLGIETGQATDLMTAQDLLRPVAEELTPMSESTLHLVHDQVQDPFISDYMLELNQATKAKVEANKSNTGYVLNEVPKTEADKVFDAIIAQYKGKVIYVDFWATWCGPCRSSMRHQQAMKKDLEDQDIVFVYITNPSSPEQTYKNIIPTIKGEHYRVTQDEWNYLSSKFNISGIPHYAIVDKEGRVVDPNAPREPNVLVKKFEELMTQ